jgi:hypothetical protein
MEQTMLPPLKKLMLDLQWVLLELKSLVNQLQSYSWMTILTQL